ncbi:hypothetical protein Y046_3823 [Burkholderia pseudomallei MSHR2990]|nr:hypothetical protein Y046_3823 [Burkholderia pseudomallei MSHR2990]
MRAAARPDRAHQHPRHHHRDAGEPRSVERLAERGRREQHRRGRRHGREQRRLGAARACGTGVPAQIAEHGRHERVVRDRRERGGLACGGRRRAPFERRRREREHEAGRRHRARLGERRERHGKPAVQQNEDGLARDRREHERVARERPRRQRRAARRERDEQHAGRRERGRAPVARRLPLAQHDGRDQRRHRRQRAEHHARVDGRRQARADDQQHRIADAAARRLHDEQPELARREARPAQPLRAHQRVQQRRSDQKAQRGGREGRQAIARDAARDDRAADAHHRRGERQITDEFRFHARIVASRAERVLNKIATARRRSGSGGSGRWRGPSRTIADMRRARPELARRQRARVQRDAKRPGVMPNWRTNARVRWLWSAKPASAAACAIDRPRASNARARRARD